MPNDIVNTNIPSKLKDKTKSVKDTKTDKKEGDSLFDKMVKKSTDKKK